jgi:hypothetical protein
MGGMQLRMVYTRQSGTIVRYNILPMILVGCISAAVPMLDDDAVAQVGARVGLGTIAVFTAIMSAMTMTDVAGSQQQTTMVDYLGMPAGPLRMHAISRWYPVYSTCKQGRIVF